jgi:DNA-binding transcriptional ArsR family regulator
MYYFSIMILTERISAVQLNRAANMIKIIAHPVRLMIVDALCQNKKMTVSEIQDLLGLQQAVASQHITLMQDKGVLKSEKVGRNKYISLQFPNMKKIITCMEYCCNQ